MAILGVISFLVSILCVLILTVRSRRRPDSTTANEWQILTRLPARTRCTNGILNFGIRVHITAADDTAESFGSMLGARRTYDVENLQPELIDTWVLCFMAAVVIAHLCKQLSYNKAS